MTRDRWQRVQEVFEAALMAEPRARPALIAERCGGDAELAREVESLLEADIGAEAWEASFAGLADPQEIGPFRIERRLGEGGMGVVYLGVHREANLPIRVAIKMLPAARVPPMALRRFLAEQRLLARLDHPGVAKVLDGGTTGDGRPYFVMEYVEGVPITHYCRGLALSARLDLFRAVAKAVHAAHQNLIIHRDLKPSNVLVDIHGAPKLLDFGVAKDLRLGLSGEPLTSGTSPPGFTPAYASPEQLRGEPVSTASDVFSLGVLLYELVTGIHPFGREGARDPDRVLPPSRAVGERRLQRRLAGDLDSIVLTALRAAPAERYTSASALAEDLERFQKNLPIQARRQGRAYRAYRFMQRNAVAVAVVTAAFLALASLSMALAAQRAALIRERDASRAVQAFLTELFRGADTSQRTGREPTLRELLDRGTARIEHELRDEPEVREQLLEVLAEVRVGLWQLDEAVPLLEELIVLQRARAGAGSPAVVRTALWLGSTWCRLGRLADAERLYQEAIAAARAPSRGGERAGALTALGGCYLIHGRHEAAADPLELARVARLERADTPPQLVYGTLLFLGLAAAARGELSAAARDLEISVALRRAVGIRADVVTGLLHLGSVEAERGRLEEARLLLAEAEEEAREVLGEAHPLTASARVRSAWVRELAGDQNERGATARADAIRADVALLEAHPATMPHDLAEALFIASRSAWSRGDLEEAEALARKTSTWAAMHDYGGPSLRARWVFHHASLAAAAGQPELARALFGSVSGPLDRLAEERRAVAAARIACAVEDEPACVEAAADAEVHLLLDRSEAHRELAEMRASAARTPRVPGR